MNCSPDSLGGSGCVRRRSDLTAQSCQRTPTTPMESVVEEYAYSKARRTTVADEPQLSLVRSA